MKQWQAFKASVEGTPLPELKEPPPQEVYQWFGRAVADEMMDDPAFFRLIVGKMAGKLFGLV